MLGIASELPEFNDPVEPFIKPHAPTPSASLNSSLSEHFAPPFLPPSDEPTDAELAPTVPGPSLKAAETSLLSLTEEEGSAIID